MVLIVMNRRDEMSLMNTNTLRYDMAGRKRRKRAVKGETYKKYKAPKFIPMESSLGPVRRDEGIVYKSADMAAVSHSPSTVDPPKYTGTLIKGIATMHKSNAVPVINAEQAKDIANMRRN